MRINDETGYLEPTTRRGFDSERKKVFIQRFSLCSNMKAVCRSIFIDVQAVYDAVALDVKFRTDFIRAYSIVERGNRLNDELVDLANSEKQTIVNDLNNKINKYV